MSRLRLSDLNPNAKPQAALEVSVMMERLGGWLLSLMTFFMFLVGGLFVIPDWLHYRRISRM